jgi:hypothetical protein
VFYYRGQVKRDAHFDFNRKPTLYNVKNYRIYVSRFFKKGSLVYFELSRPFEDILNYKDPDAKPEIGKFMIFKDKMYSIDYSMPFPAFKEKYLTKNHSLEKILTDSSMMVQNNELLVALLFDTKSNISCKAFKALHGSEQRDFMSNGSNCKYCFLKSKSGSGPYQGTSKVFRSLLKEGHFEFNYYYSPDYFINRFSGYMLSGEKMIEFDLSLYKIVEN